LCFFFRLNAQVDVQVEVAPGKAKRTATTSRYQCRWCATRITRGGGGGGGSSGGSGGLVECCSY
jgi:hypothetical protein